MPISLLYIWGYGLCCCGIGIYFGYCYGVSVALNKKEYKNEKKR